MRNKTTNIYTEWHPLVNNLSDQDAGKIFKYILSYQQGEDIKSTHPIWLFIKQKIDDYNKKGEEISEVRRELGRKGGLAKASNSQVCLAKLAIKENKTKQKKIYKRNIFKKPTLEEIKKYCEERKNTVDHIRFLDHYTRNGWMAGKSPVKDWKACVRVWERTPSATTLPENKNIDCTDKNKALVNNIKNEKLSYRNCWDTLVKLSKDLYITWNGREVASSFIKKSGDKLFSSAQLELIEGILVRYVTGK
jgi:hypothetical protein